MFGSLGVPEILFLLVLALLIFGPKRLPEIGRTIGKGLSEFRRASSELKRSIETEMTVVERQVEEERRAAVPPLLAAEPIRPAVESVPRAAPEHPPAGTLAVGAADVADVAEVSPTAPAAEAEPAADSVPEPVAPDSPTAVTPAGAEPIRPE